MASTMGRSENARHVYMVSLYYVCFDGWPRWVWIQKKGKLTTSHRYNPIPLLRSRPGGVLGELVV